MIYSMLSQNKKKRYHLLLELKVAPDESVLWRNPDRRHGEVLNGYIEEEEAGEET